MAINSWQIDRPSTTFCKSSHAEGRKDPRSTWNNTGGDVDLYKSDDCFGFNFITTLSHKSGLADSDPNRINAWKAA
ncbi:hypothetical protein [Kitasatospora sp. NPDC093102]|uniref:hypothetical protein n=1 Tax=Kitasatospora sp. NPDC093102 TaxID=3155069 RepID=UPI003438260D